MRVRPEGECPARRLPRAFFLRDALAVAPDLLGKVLVRRSPEGVTAGRIVETEAYLGCGDAAAHVHRRGRTVATGVQFKEGGHAYIYLIYGLHACLNIVANTAGQPDTVLIRALEPLRGVDLMRARRGSPGRIERLCDGPGKLCAAMGITPRLSGLDVCQGEPCRSGLCGPERSRADAADAGREEEAARPHGAEDDLYVEWDDAAPAFAIERTPRRNIPYAGEAAGFLRRFVIKDSPFASR